MDAGTQLEEVQLEEEVMLEDLDEIRLEIDPIKVFVGDKEVDMTERKLEEVKDVLKDRDPFDYNLYTTKKTITQGLYNIALLSANAFQLRSLVQVGLQYNFYIPMMCLISLSIVLQIVVGVFLLLIGKSVIRVQRHDKEGKKADFYNNIATALVLCVTIVNVVISAFGLSQPEQVRDKMIEEYDFVV